MCTGMKQGDLDKRLVHHVVWRGGGGGRIGVGGAEEHFPSVPPKSVANQNLVLLVDFALPMSCPGACGACAREGKEVRV